MIMDLDFSVLPVWIQITFVLFFGLSFGSFLNVVVIRMPLGISLVRPPSRCNFCKTPIKFYMNIPLISFFANGGACYYCGYAYSARYPAIEALTALMFLAVWSIYGLGLSMVLMWAFSLLMVAISFIDLEFKIIPDELSIGGWVVALVVSAFGLEAFPVSFAESLLASIGGAAFFWIIARIFYFVTKEEGLGGGDIKLIGLIGAVLGLKGVITSILWGSLLGCVVGFIFVIYIMRKSKRFPIPFGPFLAVGALVNVFKLDDFFWQKTAFVQLSLSEFLKLSVL